MAATSDPRTTLDAFQGTSVLVLGDVMVDAYLWGRVDRISPEAPVPVVHVYERSARLGGAANVALNLAALGARPVVVSTVGHDAEADRLERLLKEAGLSTEGIVRAAERSTTVKTRVISGHQHIVRVDEETLRPLSLEEEDALLKRFRERLSADRPAVVVIEDYNKGVLTPRAIAGALEACREAGVPVTVDPKKENFFAYTGVALFKPNLKELREGLKTDLAGGDQQAVRSAVADLEAKLGNTLSLITLSEHGIYVHGPGEEHFLPAHRRKIADVSGAGDTVIAVASLCLAHGLPPRTIAAWSNLAGGLVCEEVGVVPLDPDRFRAELDRIRPEA